MPLINIDDTNPLKCPITLMLLEDPVLASDGNTYSKKAIEECFKGSRSNLMGVSFPNTSLTTNRLAQNLIDEYKKQNRICSYDQFWNAIKTGSESTVDKLNYLDKHLDMKNSITNETPLLYSIKKGYYDLAKYLISNGANPNCAPKNTPDILYYCVKRTDDAELIRLIFTHSSKEQKVKYFSRTYKVLVPKERYHGISELQMSLIHMASCENHHVILLKLLECAKKCNIDSNINRPEPSTGFTALHFAAFHNHFQSAKILLANGSSVDPIVTFSYEFVGQAGLHTSERLNVTPLFMSVKNANYSMANLFKENHANINFSPNFSWPIIFFCCRDTDNVDLLKLLKPEGYLDKFVKVYYHDNKFGESCDRIDDWSMLHLSIYSNNKNIFQYLIDIGTNVNLKSTSNLAQQLTPLHLAAMHGRTDMVKKLCEKGANVNALSYYQYTPLHYAIKYDHELTCKFLLQKGANLYQKSSGFFKRSQTPYDYALYYGRYKLANELISYFPNKVEELNQKIEQLSNTIALQN